MNRQLKSPRPYVVSVTARVWRILDSRTGAGTYLFALFVFAICAQCAVAPAEPTGPDIAAYSRIASDQQTRSDYWSDPEAFDGNFWAMAYPTLMAQFMRISGGDLHLLVTFQILLVGSLVLVPWVLLRGLGIGTAAVASAALALNPALWAIGPSVGYEPLLAWLLSASLLAAWLVKFRPDFRRWLTIALAFLSGASLAVATLTQTKSLIVAPVIAYLLWSRQSRLAVMGAVGTFVGLSPWIFRNLVILGNPSPFTNNGPYNLWVGNNPEAVTGGSIVVAPIPPIGDSLTSAAIKFIVSQPERWIELTFLKSVRLFEPMFVYPDVPGALSGALHLWAGLLASLTALGVVFYWGAMLLMPASSIPRVRTLAVIVALFFLAHLPFIAEPRFLTSILPVTVSVAIAFWGAFVRRLVNSTGLRERLRTSTGSRSRRD